MADIVIYTKKNGGVELDVSLTEDTVWLSLAQMVKLFGRDKSVISRHINNIFKIKELRKNSTVAKFATVQKEGTRSIKREVDYYNLDAIISIGYRVNSKEGIRFRRWASQVLKEHLLRGYTTYEKRLAERGVSELQQTVDLLKKTLVHHELDNELGKEAIQVIAHYAKTWSLLLAYDEGRLALPTKGKTVKATLDYATASQAIASLKADLASRKEASALFGNELKQGLASILGSIEQTFDGKPLYRTAEEKAANLLYLIIKDHPFSDGNKRIGSFLFLLYLRSQHIAFKLNETGLVALTLLVAESEPKQKDLMIRLIVNMLLDE